MADYTISYNVNGGVGTIANETATGGSTFTLNAGTLFSFTGYTLNKWNTASDGSGTDYALGYVFETYTLEEGLTLYAQWTAVEYTITYNGITGATHTNPATYTILTPTITLSAGEKTGFTFGGWYSEEELSNAITTIALGSTGNKTLYAKFTANTYTVSYNNNTGTGTISNGTATYGQSFTTSDGTGFTAPAGYGVISHWNTSADNTGTTYQDGVAFTYTLTANLALYAIWTPVFYYNEDGEIQGLTAYGKTLGTITIPSAIDTIDIVKIVDNAFTGDKTITSVEIGANVTDIGQYAFAGCKNLATLTFASGSKLINIGESAFSNIGIAAVAIPDDVIVLETKCFANCKALAEVTFGASATLEYIGAECFSGCYQLATIVLPDTVTDIENFAFSGCLSLASIIIPEDVVYVGYHTFNACPALTINIVATARPQTWNRFFCENDNTIVYGYTE